MTTERHVTLPDGTTLWTATSGIGPPLLMCHGGPGLWDYLEPLAALLDSEYRVIRYDQRGCGRSTGADGPYTIARALDDIDQLRVALGIDQWAVLGHSWGAELALRYAGRHPDRTVAVIYIAGVGIGDDFREEFGAEQRRRLGDDVNRWLELSESGRRTDEDEREFCLLQWCTDYSPSSDGLRHAAELWETRPAGARFNLRANRELWADRTTEDLSEIAASVTSPVTMIFGADDPRPWTAAQSLFDAIAQVERTVLRGAGHAPWVERADAVRPIVLDALRAAYGSSAR